jgi:hypothetical protein
MTGNCTVNCTDNPDAVDKKDWKCVSCGADLKDAFAAKIKRTEDAVKNIKVLEAQAAKAASEAYNKVFSDSLNPKDVTK